MSLSLDKINVPMKLVYQLSEDLKHHPERVAKAQALTGDKSKPFGLKGEHGLYGSEVWWNNIKKGVLPVRRISGIIERLFISGQERDSQANTFDLLLSDGSLHTESILVNDQADYQLFKVGSRVEILYVFDELKVQPAPEGDVNYLDILLEMAVSQ